MAKETRRQEIIDTAMHLFRTKGYETTTMQDIMKELNIAKGTIYHYFTSKEALFDVAIEQLSTANLAHMKAKVAGAKGNAIEKIMVIFDAAALYEENRSLIDHLHSPGKEALHTRLLAYTLSEEAKLLAPIIQQGCDEGLFDTEHPLEASEFILAGVQFLIDVGVYPWSDETIRRRVLTFPSLVERQLGAKPGTFAFLAKIRG